MKEMEEEGYSCVGEYELVIFVRMLVKEQTWKRQEEQELK